MSKILRCVVLILVLGLTVSLLPSTPARATGFNSAYLTASLPTIRLDPNSNGGVTLYVETTNGDGRFLSISPAGGHWEIHSMHSLPTGTNLELDSNGYPIVHQDT